MPEPASPACGGAELIGEPAALRWWLWPHLLSLDAPLVAVTWQMWWARVTGTPLSGTQYAVLGLAVWMIYLADRLADAARNVPGEWLTDRHAFYARHAAPMRLVLAAVMFGLVAATPLLLPARQFAGGLVLLGITGVYYWMVHHGHGRRYTRPEIPKELIVGGMFSLGSAFFVLSTAGAASFPVWGGLALFGALCFLNCGLISAWERSPRDRDDPASLLNVFPRLTSALGTGALLLAGAALLLALGTRSVAPLPIALSALALWGLDRRRSQFSPAALRLLADLVLLTPLLGFIGRWASG